MYYYYLLLWLAAIKRTRVKGKRATQQLISETHAMCTLAHPHPSHPRPPPPAGRRRRPPFPRTLPQWSIKTCRSAAATTLSSVERAILVFDYEHDDGNDLWMGPRTGFENTTKTLIPTLSFIIVMTR